MEKPKLNSILFCIHFLMVAGIIVLFPLSAAAAEEIVWISRNFPPAFIVKGDMAGQGVHDRTVAMLQRHMPEYLHRNIQANLPRTKAMMESGKTVCRAGLYRNPSREAAMYMSISHILVPPYRIFIRKELLPKLRPMMEKEGENRISLENLMLHHPELILGLEAERRFGNEIDEILNRHAKHLNTFARYTSDTAGYIEMLTTGRTDYIIELPPVVMFILRKDKAALDRLCSIEIAESGNFQPAHVGCSKTPAGKMVIDRINAILEKERSTDAFREYLEKWVDEDTVPALRKAYKEAYQSNSSGAE